MLVCILLICILLIAAVRCAAGWFYSKLATLALLHFMDAKGYARPTPAEVKIFSRKIAVQTVNRLLGWLGLEGMY